MGDTHRSDPGTVGRPGFTLIELLIVMIIIGILAAIAVVRYGEVRARAWEETLKSDVRSLVKHQELHHMTHDTYGTLAEITQYISSPGTIIDINYASPTGWSGTATHEALGDRTCGVFVGDAPPAGGAPATVPEVLACTED